MLWLWYILGAVFVWVIIYVFVKEIGKFNKFILYGTTKPEKKEP